MKKNVNWKKNIALFVIGQGITLFGSMLVHYAVFWHITLETQSGVMMTLVTAAGTLPMFFISPFAGVWADRYNKKLLINIADGSIAVVTLGLAIMLSKGIDNMGLLLLLIALRAGGQGVQMPAVNALIPELVPQEHLTRVNGISGGLQSFIMFASPMAGGAMLAFLPIHILMYIDVITASIGISVLIFLVKVPLKEQATEIKAGAKQYFLEIGEGLKYIKKRAFLMKFLLLSAIFNIFMAPVAAMTPLQVARKWGDGIWTIFGNASFGAEQRLASIEITYFLGMMFGGLLIGIWGGFKNKSHTMALSTFLLGIGAVALGVIPSFWIYLIVMGFSGFVMNLFNPPMMAALQINVDTAYMGRVFSVLMMMSSVMMPLGMVVWGPLADIVLIDWLLVVSGVVIFFMGFFFILDKTLLKAGIATKADES